MIDFAGTGMALPQYADNISPRTQQLNAIDEFGVATVISEIGECYVQFSETLRQIFSRTPY
jgi:hypothetical protein